MGVDDVHTMCRSKSKMLKLCRNLSDFCGDTSLTLVKVVAELFSITYMYMLILPYAVNFRDVRKVCLEFEKLVPNRAPIITIYGVR